MNELPDNIYEEIQRFSAEGDSFAENRAYEEAISKYNEAWGLVPEPKNKWRASTWLLTAIGDACFLSGYYQSGIEALNYALHCPEGVNPFIHLRLGQCALEKGNIEEAAEHLTRAYMLEGKEIFSQEDNKYFDFLKTKIQPPASGEW